jgi:hypothetical protein
MRRTIATLLAPVGLLLAPLAHAGTWEEAQPLPALDALAVSPRGATLVVSWIECVRRGSCTPVWRWRHEGRWGGARTPGYPGVRAAVAMDRTGRALLVFSTCGGGAGCETWAATGRGGRFARARRVGPDLLLDLGANARGDVMLVQWRSDTPTDGSTLETFFGRPGRTTGVFGRRIELSSSTQRSSFVETGVDRAGNASVGLETHDSLHGDVRTAWLHRYRR